MDKRKEGRKKVEREHVGWFSSGTKLRISLRVSLFHGFCSLLPRLSYFLDWTVPLSEPSSLIVVASITLFVYGRTYRSINRTDNAPVDPTYRPP